MLAELETVIARDLPHLRRTARRYLHNPEDAEDAVQDAALCAVRKIGTFEGRAQLSTWLQAIVRNAALMKLRRGSLVFVSLDEPLPNGDGDTFADLVPSPADTPEQVMQGRQCSILFQALLQKLSATQRVVLLLRCDGHSCDDIAAITGVPVGTVKARIARGKAMLKKHTKQLRALGTQ